MRNPRQFENRFIAFTIPFVWIANEEMRQSGINLHISSVLRILPESVNPIYKNFHWGDMIRAIYEAYEHGCDLSALIDAEGNIAEGAGLQRFRGEGRWVVRGPLNRRKIPPKLGRGPPRLRCESDLPACDAAY
jgi:hypothetical protein